MGFSRAAFSLLSLCLLLSCRRAPLAPVSPPPPPPPAPATAPDPHAAMRTKVMNLVGELGAQDVKTRDSAIVALRDIGWPAMAKLLVALDIASDLESKVRIRMLVDDICWTRGALVSPKDPDALQQLRAVSPRDRYRHDPLLSTNQARMVVFRADVLHSGKNEQIRADRSDKLKTVRFLVQKEAYAEAQWLLIACCIADGDEDRCIAELLYIARKVGNAAELAIAVTALKSLVHANESSANNLILALTLASGDTSQVLRLAVQNRDYAELVLADADDWRSLAALPLNPREGRTALVRAAALLFAGDHAGADQILTFRGDRFEENVVNAAGRTPLMLGYPDVSHQLFVHGKDYLDAVLYLLLQRRYHEAFDVVEKGNAVNFDQSAALEAQILPALVRLNEIDRARTLIKSFDRALDEKNVGWVTTSIAEALFEMRDFEALATLVSRRPRDVDMGYICRQFPRSIEPGIWMLDGNAAAGSKASQWSSMISILKNSADPSQVVQLADALPPSVEPPGVEQTPVTAIPLYPLYRLEVMGRSDLAAKYKQQFISQAPSARYLSVEWNTNQESPRSPLDDILALRRPQLSRDLLEAICRAPEPDVAFHFLFAVCRERTGDAIAGRRQRIQCDERLAGDLPRRLYLAQVLRGMGEADLAREQAQLVASLDQTHAPNHFQAQMILSQIALDRGDYARALHHLRMYVIDRIYWWQMPEDRSKFVRIPRTMAFCEAMLGIQENNRKSVIPAATRLCALDPEDLTFTLQVVAGLKQKHWTAEAEFLAAHNRALLENILKDFPNSHLHHSLIAKLDTDSGFTTSQTRVHFQKARSLQFKSPIP